ncbi:MAG: RsmD family RNA methyltransferase [Planctomycetota bacterium]
MWVRIIAGEFKGRRLATVPGRTTRPLLARVREAVFNVLGDRVEGAEVWDLFAGTGASGIECLSRGAARVVFVEKARAALSVLRSNLERLGLGGSRGRRHVLVAGDAWEPGPIPRPGGGLDGPETPPELVLLDPPYAAVRQDRERALESLDRLKRRLSPDGVLVFHYCPGLFGAGELEALGRARLRRWGSSEVAFLERS